MTLMALLVNGEDNEFLLEPKRLGVDESFWRELSKKKKLSKVKIYK